MAETERRANGRCKPCAIAYSAAWAKANPEKAKDSNAKWYKANTEKANARNKAWQKANRERVNAASYAWKKAHPERMKECNAAWHEANRDNQNARQAEKRKAMPDWYIKQIIIITSSIPKQANIPAEMIEAKRVELKLNRLIKELKK
jgi:hypothetical protein